MLCLLLWVVLVFAWLVGLLEALKESGQGSGVQFRSRVWKRLRDPLGSDPGLPGVKFSRVHQEDEGHVPDLAREGIG